MKIVVIGLEGKRLTMDKQQFLLMLQVAFQQHPSMQIHSLYLEDKIYNHNEKKCPRCIAIWFLEHDIDN